MAQIHDKMAKVRAARVTNAAVPRKTSAATYVAERQKFRMQEDLRKLRYAIDDAENLVLFNREQLHRIYKECYKDPHFRSQWGTRKLKTIEKEFAVITAGDEKNEDATQILEAQWFLDLMDEILESKVFGFRLIEFGPVLDGKIVAYRADNGRVYDAISVIEPDNVKPEFGIITRDPGMNTGIPFEGGKYDDQLLFVGKRHDFGLMMSAVKYILFKDNCIANWSEWAEIFGMDVRVGKTYGEGDAKTAFFKTIRDIGTSGYGVIDKDDELDFAGTSRTDAYKVYEALIDTTDKNISKLIFGQDVVTNNTGRVVGEVGENISNLYGDSDAKFVARIINDHVLPKLTAMGVYNFSGLRFKWDTSEKLTLTEQAAIDLEISQMGWRPSQKYLEDKYNIQLEEPPTPPATKPAAGKGAPTKVKVAKALKELYADSVE